MPEIPLGLERTQSPEVPEAQSALRLNSLCVLRAKRVPKPEGSPPQAEGSIYLYVGGGTQSNTGSVPEGPEDFKLAGHAAWTHQGLNVH